MNKPFYLFLIALAFVFVFEDTGAVYAQIVGDEEFTLEEITVTAQKREENVQKVPITMEVFSGDRMKELGQKDIDEILSSVGGMIFNKTSDGYRVSLHGIVDDDDLYSEMHISTPTVAISTDGAYSTRSDRGLDLFDVERVEVLFGPQSTQYANTSPGGIINVITAAPKTDKFEASGTVEFGNYGYLRTEGSLNAPINDKMALRAAFSTSARDGYISNGADDEDKKSARLKALYQPNEDLSFTITGEYSFNGGHGFASVEPFIDQDDVDNPWEPVETDLGNPRDETQKGVNVNMTWNSKIGTLTMIPSYSTNTSSSTEIMTDRQTNDTSTQKTEMDMTEKGADVRMVSSSDFLFKWIAGVNYNKSSNGRYQSYVEKIETGSSDIDEESHAFYGNITYPVTDKFRVTGGARKSWDTISTYATALNALPRGGNGPTQPGTTTTNPDGTTNTIEDYEQEYDNMDYKVGVEYDISENAMVYADWSTSYRMQGMAKPLTTGSTPPPEEMSAITLGSKNRLFGNKLQINVSAYYYKYMNKLTKQAPWAFESLYEDDPRFIEAGFTAADGTQGMDIDNNGTITHTSRVFQDTNTVFWGDFESSGVDVMTSWIITNKDKLDFSVAYNKNEWTDLYFDFVYEMIYPDFDYSGKTNISSPEIAITVAYNHDFILGNGATLIGRFDTRYQSSYFLTYHERESPWRDQEAHHISNISLMYANPSGRWTLTGYTKNIENYAVKQGMKTSSTGVAQSMMIGSPRTYGGILSVRF